MQLTQQTLELYKAKAPELLDAVMQGEAEHVMRRNEVTDYCVKFENGWCGIHKQYGEEFLGDACHFYPRITRSMGERVVTTLALSCPEAARRMILTDAAFDRAPRAQVREPFSLKNYLPEGVASDAAMATHDVFIEQAGNAAYTAERNVMRLSTVARGLETQATATWPQAVAFYFRLADGRLPAAEAAASDPFHLLQALAGLISAAKATQRPALMWTVGRMEEALGAKVDWPSRGLAMAEDAAQRWLKMVHTWRAQHEAMQPILRRYLQAQLSMAMFPYAGLGATLSERVTILGVRFATFKLALMSELVLGNGMPNHEDIVRVAYSLSRFLDHLADPALSLAVYAETGWNREPRLRALVGDA